MKLSRRIFIKRLFLSGLGFAGIIYLDSFWIEKYIIDWNEHDLSENSKDKIKIIQLSDLHLKEIKYFHKTIAERINSELPDLIVFTGDTISRRNSLNIFEELLNLIHPKILKILILGNKEYDARVAIEVLKKAFAPYNGYVLVNENFSYIKNKRRINILGIDDYLHGRPDFNAAVSTIEDTSLETVVLNHCPAYTDSINELNKTTKLNLKMVLSGHTHGGQVTFFGRKIYTPDGSGRYLKGWYTSGSTKMYVSKGIGTTVLPLRFFARAEASIFYL
tara:strand:+ start:23005 stop:23832 length:828 start_codon:yes stop_codon:yes gene_type:complete